MKLTNNQIFGLTEAIAEFKEKNFELPIRTGFKLLKNLQALQSTYNVIIEMRNALISKHSEQGQEISKAAISAINEELEELGLIEQEVELQSIDLKDVGHLKLSLNLLNRLQVIIKDED